VNLRDRSILLIAPEIITLRAMPCTGLGYIGSYLKQQGLNVRIIDSQFTKEDPIPVLRATAPTLVAIGVDSRTIYRGLRIARVSKAHGHTTLLGGLHVSLIKADILDYPEVDFAIIGDGEAASYQLIEALEGMREFSEVSGLVYRGSDGARHMNPNTSELNDLDTLPFPDYRLAGIDQFRLYPLVTSRDCPHRCTYCAVGSISHGRFRARSAGNCVDEIFAAKELYNIKGFLVVDENFSFDMDRVMAFCQLLVERKVNLPWTVFEGMRADCLNDDVLKLLKASGCRWILFGIESVENAVLKEVRKGEKLLQIKEAIHLARKYGFKVGGFFIVGLPTSSFRTDMRSLRWALDNLDKATFWMSIPYYNTPLFHWVQQNARLLRQPVGDGLVNSLSTMPFYDMPTYPAKEVKRAHVIASLRTGVQYFFEYLDREAYDRRRWSQKQESETKRKLIETVLRYDPSWLPNLVDGLAFADVPDPLASAIEASTQESDTEHLTTDMLGRLGSPAAPGQMPTQDST
jgi:radical SAM superfamily enzyme YgiQ (UPF0313 family)